MQHIASMINTPYKKTAVNAQENFNTLEKINIEKLGMVINGSIKAISVMNNITKNEVVGILGKIYVTTIDEVQKAVENLEDIEGIDVVRLTVGIEETIKAISGITNLGTGEITETFAKKKGATVEDIANRLHAKSKAACSSSTLCLLFA